MIKVLLKKIPLARRINAMRRYLELQARFGREDAMDLSQPLGTLPWPPAKLRHRVHGQADRDSFSRVGEECARNIRELLASHQRPLESLGHVLDFGCGCGRVLRHFAALSPKVQFLGTDIDPEGIAWNKSHLSMGSFEVNNAMPPTRHASGTFDLLYAISIFTHLDEPYQFAWLDEIARLLKPGGIALLTVHGETGHAAMAPEKRSQLQAKGFVFEVAETGRFKLDGLPDFYQTAYHTEAYIRSHWNRGMRILGYHPAAINHHQDAVILERLPG
jgi:SAM-dependent methyltransferase